MSTVWKRVLPQAPDGCRYFQDHDGDWWAQRMVRLNERRPQPRLPDDPAGPSLWFGPYPPDAPREGCLWFDQRNPHRPTVWGLVGGRWENTSDDPELLPPTRADA